MCERDSVCEVAVREGDDGGHAGARSRVSRGECHGMVCEHRDTQVCVGGMATTTATFQGQRPSGGRSCLGNCAGFARRRARGSDRSMYEAAACAAARVKPCPETYAVDVANPADGQKLGWDNGFGMDGFSRRACV